MIISDIVDQLIDKIWHEVLRFVIQDLEACAVVCPTTLMVAGFTRCEARVRNTSGVERLGGPRQVFSGIICSKPCVNRSCYLYIESNRLSF